MLFTSRLWGIADSEELIKNSGLPSEALIEIGNDHRLADPEPLAKMLEASTGKPSSGKAEHYERQIDTMQDLPSSTVHSSLQPSSPVSADSAHSCRSEQDEAVC